MTRSTPRARASRTFRSRIVVAAALAAAMAAPVSSFALCESAIKDKDKDGLTNCAETLVTGTDPRSADTDGDGLSDGLEQASGLDPLIADEDSDGINDGAEAVTGTDPRSGDSDNDGIEDSADHDPADKLCNASAADRSEDRRRKAR